MFRTARTDTSVYVRRDVKSSNVLLTRDGTAKLGDLGLAAIVNDSFDFQDISVGHFAYMAPELVLGMECTTKVCFDFKPLSLTRMRPAEAEPGPGRDFLGSMQAVVGNNTKRAGQRHDWVTRLALQHGLMNESCTAAVCTGGRV